MYFISNKTYLNGTQYKHQQIALPSQVELDQNEINDEIVQNCDQFTPVKTSSQAPSRFTGVRISSFPKNADYGQVIEYLISSGLPEGYKDDISMNKNGTVMIDNLPNNVCIDLIQKVHNKFSFGRKLYCNGVVPRTPDKAELNPDQDQESMSEPVAQINNAVVPSLLSPMSPNTFSQQYSETPDLHLQHCSNEVLARRNSLSLCNRTPPPGSMADELLNSEKEGHHLTKVKSMLSDIKDMAERFSDFASCESLSDGNETDKYDGFQLHGRKKRKKQKMSPTPTKDYFLKKPNLGPSPSPQSRK